MTQPKIEEVYRCPECDKGYSDAADATKCCVTVPPLEYKCLAKIADRIEKHL